MSEKKEKVKTNVDESYEPELKKKDRNPVLNWMIENALIVVILLMVIYTTFAADNFLNWNNLRNLMSNVGLRYVIALGISGTLITRGTDLSAGRIVGLSAVMSAIMLQRPDGADVLYPGLAGSPIWVTLLVAMAIGLVCGALNGVIIAFLDVPPFITTLGTQIAIFGINQMVSKNEPIGSLNSSYTKFGNSGLSIGSFTIPWIAVIAIVVALIMAVLYKKTIYGKNMYAIGGNETSAIVSGVNVRIYKLLIYSVAGLLYGLAGFLLTARTGSAAVTAGTGYELEAIAAATIGGVSTAGGVGTVSGILVGVVVFELLKTVLQFLGISPELTLIIQGVVIVVAVALDIRKTKRKK